jgi:hypothetical protein
VIAGPVAERVAVLVGQAGQQKHVVAERLERLEDARELEPVPPPIGVQSAIVTPFGT